LRFSPILSDNVAQLTYEIYQCHDRYRISLFIANNYQCGHSYNHNSYLIICRDFYPQEFCAKVLDYLLSNKLPIVELWTINTLSAYIFLSYYNFVITLLFLTIFNGNPLTHA